MVTEIQSEEQFNALLSGGGLVVADFYATWCGPCVALKPKFEALAAQNPTVKFIKIDVDKLEELAAVHKISAMPTILFFKGGKQVDQVVGADIAGITSKVASHK